MTVPSERLDLPVAVRALPVVPERKKKRAPKKPPPAPDVGDLVVVFDSETRTDLTQALLLASYRVFSDGRLMSEALIGADDLDPAQRSLLHTYRDSHRADNGRRLRVVTRQEFADIVLLRLCYRSHATLVGLNLPFDMSRLALGWRPSDGGGITLRFWPEWVGPDGRVRVHKYRPEIAIRTLDSRRSLIQFTATYGRDPSTQFWRGAFVDCRTLAYALSDRGYSLAGAAKAFGLVEQKAHAERHGVLTPEYIDYNRQDVRTTAELFFVLLEEYRRHPIGLPVTQALSAAGIGKGYLEAMGIEPALG